MNCLEKVLIGLGGVGSVGGGSFIIANCYSSEEETKNPLADPKYEEQRRENENWKKEEAERMEEEYQARVQQAKKYQEEFHNKELNKSELEKETERKQMQEKQKRIDEEGVRVKDECKGKSDHEVRIFTGSAVKWGCVHKNSEGGIKVPQ